MRMLARVAKRLRFKQPYNRRRYRSILQFAAWCGALILPYDRGYYPNRYQT